MAKPIDSLEELLDSVRESAPPPPDDAVYAYLRKVYRSAGKLTREQGKALKRRAKKAHPHTQHSRVRAIIDLTAPPHIRPKMRWKYAAALKYAQRRGIEAHDLIQFIKGKGGLNQCVKKLGQMGGSNRSTGAP